jgi:hypothetical protein
MTVLLNRNFVPSEWVYRVSVFNPLKPKLVYILFKNSVRTSKRTPHFTITKINWLTLFKFNPLKTKLVYMLFKNSVRTSKRTPHFTITKINWLTLFKFKQHQPGRLPNGNVPRVFALRSGRLDELRLRSFMTL